MENVYYQITTDEIFTYDYSTRNCAFAYGLSSYLRHGAPLIFKDTLKQAIKEGYVIKIGKL